VLSKPTTLNIVCVLLLFLIFDIDTIFNTEFVGMYVLYLHTKFHMPDCSDSVVTTVKPKARVCAATILLPCILHSHMNASVHTYTH
jgi:hypothetical protein